MNEYATQTSKRFSDDSIPARNLLSKYAEEGTPVLAAFVTPSVSVARVTGTIRASIVGGVPHLFIGKEDSESDRERYVTGILVKTLIGVSTRSTHDTTPASAGELWLMSFPLGRPSG